MCVSVILYAAIGAITLDRLLGVGYMGCADGTNRGKLNTAVALEPDLVLGIGQKKSMSLSDMAKSARLWVCGLACAMASAGAHTQVFKCTDDSGNVSFTDRPCVSSQKSEEMEIRAAPAQPSALSKTAAEYESERQRKRAKREELDQRVANAEAEVRKIKSDNVDAEKCSSARRKMAAMKRRDPITYNLDVSYFEFQQAAELYCGN
ncbi:MAG: hypothetical protein CME41_10790 [Haliea sp.]|jgi:hypothetical protein|nr:hypothetical protein [Haliea sp.]MAY91689.1 hypothetical protein [Haliea sp.]MBP70415.1 hypothetical protein [Haliea sp.]|tara:strand:+ start:323 stop:940 length:618 start_codon:yes stop_codon:yes gene_type:complete